MLVKGVQEKFGLKNFSIQKHRSFTQRPWYRHSMGEKSAIHDDVIKWKHFPRYWPFVRGIHRSPVNSPHNGQWRGALMFSLICIWINGWVNNREAGDLRRHRVHYDVTVMDYPDGLEPLQGHHFNLSARLLRPPNNFCEILYITIVSKLLQSHIKGNIPYWKFVDQATFHLISPLRF